MTIKSTMWCCGLVAAMPLLSNVAIAASPEYVDFSCPTAPTDQPTVFPEGTQPLALQGVIHLKDHSHSYKITYTPYFDQFKGYYDNIIVVGRQYTFDAGTQTKTYVLNKDEFAQQDVDIPFTYCRSHRVPYQAHADLTLGYLKVEDGSGASRSSRVRLGYLRIDCRGNGLCYKTGIGAWYEDQAGELSNVLFAEGMLAQDLQILER